MDGDSCVDAGIVIDLSPINVELDLVNAADPAVPHPR
jgi:hypothetical protein